MMSTDANPMTPLEQFQCLNLLDLLSDIFTGTNKETFSRAEILTLLNDCKNNPALFDPDCVVAQEEATSEFSE
jgi:hypothetical protein